MVAPPIEEPPPARNTEVHTPLPLPLPNIPVGGRLALFAQDWAKITDDKWVLSRAYHTELPSTTIGYGDLVVKETNFQWSFIGQRDQKFTVNQQFL